MADEGELEITIVDDEAANVAAAEAVEKKPEAKTQVEVKDPALRDLMAQYKELESKSAEIERRAQEAEVSKQEAEREASRHRQEAVDARKAQTSSHLDTITTAISASEQDVEGAKQAIRAAKTTGDVDAEVEAQDRLAIARATLLRLDEAKKDIEARQRVPPKNVSSDPVEAFANTLSAKSAAWVRSHPDYARSEKGLRKLTAADAIAQAEDLVPDTPEYFARVEEYLGIRKGEKAEAPTEAAHVAPAKPKSAAPPVAPGGAVANGGSTKGGSVQLTQREAAAATDGTHVWNWNDPSGKFKKGDPIGLQEMARRKMTMQRQGLYDKSYSEG